MKVLYFLVNGLNAHWPAKIDAGIPCPM